MGSLALDAARVATGAAGCDRLDWIDGWTNEPAASNAVAVLTLSPPRRSAIGRTLGSWQLVARARTEYGSVGAAVLVGPGSAPESNFVVGVVGV